MRGFVKSRVSVLYLLVCVLALVVGAPRTAQADPHAVFFTVVGQQQLFFNVLAALNQADYVETLQLRQQLAQQRDQAGYQPSGAQALIDTETQLADVLTRSISLEGQDVRTQERADEFAREVVRQRRLDDLIEKLCREAFGSGKCVFNPDEAGQEPENFLTERARSFIQDPLDYESLPTRYGALAALLSGTDEYQELAQRVIQDAQQGKQVLPLAYSQDIAALRQRSPKLADAVIETAAKDYIQDAINQGQWLDYVDIDENNEVTFSPPTSSLDNSGSAVSADDELAAHFLAMNQGLQLSQSVSDAAAAAEEWVAIQLQTVDGAVPDRVQKVQTLEDGNIVGIQTLISAPANVKVGLQRQLLLLLAQLEADPDFIDPSQIANPGGADATNQQAQLNIGAPLASFQEAEIIKKGLLPQSGVTEQAGFGNVNLLQKFLQQILNQVKQ